MTTSSTSDRGRALLMSTAAASFVLSAALAAGPALASNECGVQSGATVSCPGNQTFPSISYAPTTDLTVVTQTTDTVTGPITVTGSGTANVTVSNGASAGGINASGVANVTVDSAGAVSTSANNTPGISAVGTGNGDVTVDATGNVTTTGTSTDGSTLGANSNGVVAVNSGNGSTNVTVTNVSAQGAGSWGVLAEATGPGNVNVTVAQGGTVQAAGDAIAMGAVVPNATETLTNNGTITAGQDAFSVITIGGGAPATINNNQGATLNGPIGLGGGLPGAQNVVNNAGTWNVSNTSYFGASGTNNTLNNTGTVATSPSAQGAGPSTAYFNGLTTFNNVGGVVDLTSGNSLNIENAEFEGGQGSTLKVNANSASGVLTLASTQGGSTNVVLADIPKTNPAMDPSGELLVTGPANTTQGPSAGSFTLGGPNSMDQHAGFVDYRLVFNQATQNQNTNQNTPSSYVLFGLPGPEVFEALNIPYALQSFWRNSADVLTQRQMSLRDSQVGEHPSRAEGWEFWAIPYGGSDFFKRPQTFQFAQFNGFTFNGVGNHNDTVGLQIGADMLTHFGSGAGVWGLGIGGAGTGYWGFTGGVEQQTTHFPGDDANDLYSVGGNVGVYGGASWGGFYLNALGKVDFDDMNTNFSTAQFSPTNVFKAYGTRGEIGYRWPWSGFFVEPSARVNAVWIDGIDLNPAGALLHFNSGNASVDGEVGGRVGMTVNFGKWMPGPVSQFNPFPGAFDAYVGAWWADQWDGRNNMSFTTAGGFEGTTSIFLSQLTTGSFIHMEYGLETADWYGGLKMFLKGENNFDGDSVGGWDAMAGVRFTF